MNRDSITDLKEYAVIIGMPYPTLYRYCCDEKSKRQLIGTSTWKNSTFLNDADIYFMGDVLVWADYGENGMSRAEATDAIQKINPTLDQNQAKDQLDRRTLTKYHADGKIERSTLKAHTTTTEQTSITYQSQWRWYGFGTGMFNEVQKKDMDVCKNTAKTFGELMHNFFLGLDEACIMADDGRNIRIIGAANRKKHEKIIAYR